MKDLQIVTLDSIKEKEVDWLWYPYIPKGKLTIIQGDPGSGKTMFILKLSALLSNGEPLPFSDGQPGNPINVIYQTSEDGYDDSIKPRLRVANADCSKISFINEDNDALTMDDERIIEAIKQKNAELFVLDPIQAYVGPNVDINKANEVRPLLKRLAQIAAETNCAVVLVGHMNKGKVKSTYKGLGSIDFYAAARSVLLVGALKDNPDVRIVVQDKMSLAPTGEPFSFTLSKENGFSWRGKESITADELLDGFIKKSEKDIAMEFLEDILSDGPVAATTIIETAISQSISKRTLDDAKKSLNIKSKKEGITWFWTM